MGSNHEINRGQKLCFAVTFVEKVVADSWVGILKHFVILIIVLQYFKNKILRFKTFYHPFLTFVFIIV